MNPSRQQARDWLRRAGKCTAEIDAALGEAAPKKSKYGNSPCMASDGTRKHSKAERRWYDNLLLLERVGAISDLKAQQRVVLLAGRGIGVSMIVDATYTQDGETVWAEYKGFQTAKWRLQKRLWGHLGPGLYRVTYPSGQTEEVRPKRDHDRLVKLLGDLFPGDLDRQAAALAALESDA